MTDDEIQDARDQVGADVTSGLDSVNVDGMNVSMTDPMKRLDVLDRIEARKAARCGVLPIGITKVISRGLQ